MENKKEVEESLQKELLFLKYVLMKKKIFIKWMLKY